MPRLHLSCERQGIAKQGCAAEKCDFPCATVYRKSRNFTLFPKAVGMRQIECAFSGYARGRFFAIPCGHCSLPPRLRRLIHENLAALRFSVRYSDLFFIKITRASKTTHSDNKVIAQLCQFCMNARKRSLRKIGCVRCVSAPLFANTFAFAGKVNAARVVWCALERRAAEENSDGQAALPRAVGFSYKSRRFAGDSSPRNART